jgi:hypothetical protein
MEKELSDVPNNMPLDPAPLVYMHEHFKKINAKKLPNTWVWYKIEELEAIVAAIRALDDTATKKKGDGVRLYYGMYNDKVCDLLTRIAPNQGDFSSHLDHNTVFFVPTYEIAGGDKHIDDISPETVAKYRDDYENGRDLGHKFGGGFNVGNICPPPPPSESDCSRSGSNL